MLHLDWLLRLAGMREQVTLFWNANNTFGFDRLDWGRLAAAATITTVSRYMEHATRRTLHLKATAHPTAAWTLRQLRAAIPAAHPYRFLIHDRDAIFSRGLDQRVRHFGLQVLKTPPQSPQANALCERLLGTLRRECLDWLIPLTENYLRRFLHDWALYYNTGRPHMALGPGIPQPPPHVPAPQPAHRHRLPAHLWVVARPILGGLHHEYRLEAQVA